MYLDTGIIIWILHGYMDDSLDFIQKYIQITYYYVVGSLDCILYFIFVALYRFSLHFIYYLSIQGKTTHHI